MDPVMIYAPTGGDNAAIIAGLRNVRAALEALDVPCQLLGDTAIETVDAKAGTGNPLLLLVGCDAMPGTARAAVERYLLAGGDVCVIGGRPASKTLVRDGQSYLTLGEYFQSKGETKTLVDWSDMAVKQLEVTLAPNVSADPFSIVDDPDKTGAKMLRFHAETMGGLAQFDHALAALPSATDGLYPEGHDYLVFEARGTGPLQNLCVLLQDKKDIWWYRLLPLTGDWQTFVVKPEDLIYDGNLYGHDRRILCEPSEFQRVQLGFKYFSLLDPTGPQEFEVRDLKTGRAPQGHRPLPDRWALEPFGPECTFVPVEMPEAAARVEFMMGDEGFDAGELPGELWTMTRRPRAVGLKGESLGRWIPWASVESGDDLGGMIASSWLDRRGQGRPFVWTQLGLNPAEASVKNLALLLKPLVRFQSIGACLLRGGADSFNYLPGEPMKVGGVILNRFDGILGVNVRAAIQPAAGGDTIRVIQESFELAPGETNTWTQTLDDLDLAEGEYRVVVELLGLDGRAADRIDHLVSVHQPGGRQADRVTTDRGRFMRDGKPWTPQGMHYWHPYVGGQADPRLWHNWMGPELYDPDLFDRDAKAMAALGFTSVVVPYRSVSEAPAMRDALYRCEKYGLKCMAFIDKAAAFGYNLKGLGDLVDAARLDRQGALFALDLAWEPHLGARPARAKHDKAWTQWTIDQYGSLEAAFKLWGFTPETADGVLEGPDDDQITTEGPHAAMVAAYRQFVDDAVSHDYGLVASLLRGKIDGILLGVRTGFGGTGSQWIDPRFPFDLKSGADHLDYISPEAYALGVAPETFAPGKLMVALSRMVGRGDKPVVWMEYGRTAGGDNRFNELLETEYYRHMIKMMIESKSAASFAWFWAGGYRLGENSDFGLTEPYGRPRHTARYFADHVDDLLVSEPVPEPDVWLTVDRDLHPRGNSMLFVRQKDAFLKAEKAGHWVGFKTAGTGTTTADVPLVGVGNVAYDGVGPLKFVNGEFQVATIVTDSGLRLDLRVFNTGDATWLAGENAPGQVFVVLRNAAGKEIYRVPISRDVKGGEAVALQIESEVQDLGGNTLRLTSDRTGDFGEVFRVK